MSHQDHSRRYDDLVLIGEGGMGAVYRATDNRLDRQVAIKILNAGPNATPDSIARFERESRALAKLDHPNIVTIYDAYEMEGGNLCIVMQLVQGRPLDLVVAAEFRPGTGYESTEPPLTVVQKLRLMVAVARALDYAHGQGIVHRDLKPSNILMLEDGSPKIIDFGIAKMVDDHVTRANTSLGTIAYMSPEQFNGTPVNHQTDIYSAGVVLYELLTGISPFYEEGDTTATIRRILHGPMPTLPAGLPGVPPTVQSVLQRALARDITQRYATAADFAFELNLCANAAQNPPAYAAPTPPLRPGVTPPIVPAIAPPPAPSSARHAPQPSAFQAPARLSLREAEPTPRSNRLRSVLMLMGVLAAVAGVIWFVSRSPQSPPASMADTKTAPESSTPVTPAVPPGGSTPAPHPPPGPAPKPAPKPAPSKPGVTPKLPSSIDEIVRQADAALGRHDYDHAFPLYREACELGEAASCNETGFLYDEGQGVAKDAATAARYYAKACDADFASGCHNLAIDYHTGEGVAADANKAAFYERRACDRGDAAGCHNLGIFYDNGTGVAKDVVRAAALYRQACDGGNAGGCYALGVDYETGEGVDKNLAQAKAYYQKSCAKQYARACDALKHDVFQ